MNKSTTLLTPLLLFIVCYSIPTLYAQDAVVASKVVQGGGTVFDTGVNFIYAVTLRCDNTGTEPCMNFVLTETLPLGLEFISLIPANVFSASGAFANPTVVNYDMGYDPSFTTPGTITLDFGDIPPGSSGVITFSVRFQKHGTVPDGHAVTNSVSLTSTNDVDITNNTATAPVVEANANSDWDIDKRTLGNLSKTLLNGTTVYEISPYNAGVNGSGDYFGEIGIGDLALFNPVVIDILETGLTCADVDAANTTGYTAGNSVCIAPGATVSFPSGLTFTNPNTTNNIVAFDVSAIFPSAPYLIDDICPNSVPCPSIPGIYTPFRPPFGQGVNLSIGLNYTSPTFSVDQMVTNNTEIWGSVATDLGGNTVTPIDYLAGDDASHTLELENPAAGLSKRIRTNFLQSDSIGVGMSTRMELILSNTGNVPLSDVIIRDTISAEFSVKTVSAKFTAVPVDVIAYYTDGTNETVISNSTFEDVTITPPVGEQVSYYEWILLEDLPPGGSIRGDFFGSVLPNRFTDDYHTSRYDNPSETSDDDAGTQLSGSPVAIGEEITNCGHAEYTYNGITNTTRDCEYIHVRNMYAVIEPFKSVTPNTPVSSGNELSFTLDNVRVGGFLPSWVIYSDTLPENLSYVPGSFTRNGNYCSRSTYNLTVTPNINGTGRDLVEYEIIANPGNEQNYLQRGGLECKSSFKTIVESDHLAGTFDNTLFLTDFDNSIISSIEDRFGNIFLDENGFSTPVPGSAPNDPSAPPPINGADAAYAVIATPSGASIKFVDADISPGQSGSGGVELGSPGSQATFTLLFTNDGSEDLTQLRFIDLLPRIGDYSPLTCEIRNTEWEPEFLGNVVATHITGGVSTIISPDVQYSTDTQPCVDFYVPGPEPCGTCNSGTFSNTPPATISDVNALGIDFQSLTLLPGDTVTVSFNVDIPLSPTPEGIAWNTFAWRADGILSTAEIGAEPSIVGVATEEFDLALTKMLSTSTPGPFIPESTVSFDIQVFNQGEFDAFDIDVLDYFNTAELNFVSFSNPTMTTGGNPVTITVTDADGSDGTTGFEISDLAEADEVTITATFTIDAAFSGTSINNDSEIVAGSVFDGGSTTYDIDSDLAMTGGSGTEVDDEIADESNGGTDNPNDQDDFDFAQISVSKDYDYGDLPDISSNTGALNYQTTSANNGPSHLIIPGLHIGASVDSETDGQASTNAYGDGADEDGYSFPANLNISAGGTLNLPINLTNTTGTIAHLEAWIDWNGDGDFDDANEMVIDISDDGAGNFGMTHTPISVPSNAIQSQKIGLRFRLSHTDNMTPYGSVSTGEIEDYLIQIECESKTCLPVQLTIQKGIN